MTAEATGRPARAGPVARPPSLTLYVLRRILIGVVTLFLVSIIVFAATQALPGDAARAILGRDATPASLAALNRQLHLDEPASTQYLHWLGGLLTGNLGRSLVADQPVTELLGKPIENSAFLVLVAAAISIPLALLLGALTALWRDSLFDHVASIVLITLAGIPEFVIAIALIAVFATTVFTVLPPVSLVPPGSAPWDHPEELVLPVAVLVLAVTPGIGRLMRASTVEVLDSDYVEMARLKGLSSRRTLWRHAFPNAVPPAIQAIALNLAYLAGGIVVVEYVFAYPGIGSQFVGAVANRDIPTVQAVAILLAGVYVLLNLCADVATIVVSPRLRTSAR